MRMRGPHGKGHAEMAVSKVEGAPETPASDSYRSFEEEVSEKARGTFSPICLHVRVLLLRIVDARGQR